MAQRGRVIVIGSLNADVVVRAPTLPQPGATVLGSAVSINPGGKGLNQAVAAARAGATVRLVGCVGDDPWAADLLAFVGAEGIETTSVRHGTGSTGTAIVTVDDHGANTIVVVPSANLQLTPEAVSGELRDIEAGDLVVAQCEVPVDVVTAGFVVARERHATTILNASPLVAMMGDVLRHADMIVVNEEEAAGLGHERSEGQVVVVTLGARGADILSDRGRVRIPPRVTTAEDSTGAGDCFLGVLAAGLARGCELGAAARRAAVAASLQVERPGAAPAMPFDTEIDAADAEGA